MKKVQKNAERKSMKWLTKLKTIGLIIRLLKKRMPSSIVVVILFHLENRPQLQIGTPKEMTIEDHLLAGMS